MNFLRQTGLRCYLNPPWLVELELKDNHRLLQKRTRSAPWLRGSLESGLFANAGGVIGWTRNSIKRVKCLRFRSSKRAQKLLWILLEACNCNQTVLHAVSTQRLMLEIGLSSRHLRGFEGKIHFVYLSKPFLVAQS